jgi:hypothetical protein
MHPPLGVWSVREPISKGLSQYYRCTKKWQYGKYSPDLIPEAYVIEVRSPWRNPGSRGSGFIFNSSRSGASPMPNPIPIINCSATIGWDHHKLKAIVFKFAFYSNRILYLCRAGVPGNYRKLKPLRSKALCNFLTLYSSVINDFRHTVTWPFISYPKRDVY